MTPIIPGERGEASRMLSPSPIGHQPAMTNRINPDQKMSSKASENRRATKPIMEKRRRARINQCLTELKTLILDALNKDPSRHSKLEKADILEMTVRHLQNVQRQQMAAAISSDPTVLNKFRAGFSECASEVSRYVSRLEGVEPAIRQRLLGHLSHCINGLNAANAAFSSANGSAFPGMTPPLLSHLQALNVHIPGVTSLQPFLPSGQQHGDDTDNPATDLNNNNQATAASAPPSSPSSAAKLLSGLSLIPSRLPSGELAFLLPSSQALQGSAGHQQLLGALDAEGQQGGGALLVGGWGPPTPTSPALSSSRRSSSSAAPSPGGASSSCLSPAGSGCSELISDDEGGHCAMLLDHAPPPPPQLEPLRLQRVPSPPRPPPVDPADPVWRPW